MPTLASPRRASRPIRLIAALALVAAVALNGTFAAAGTSYGGASATAWPAAWNAYTLSTGAIISDVNDDENPAYTDIASGACSGCAGPRESVQLASDGTNAFFRIRLGTNPYDAAKGGLFGSAFLTQIYANGAVRAVVGVDGKSPSADYVYVTNAVGSTVTKVYEWPFDNSGGQSSAGMRVVAAGDGTGQYFLDYQVPLSFITAASGGTVTATTPVKLYYGSSQAANLAVINKDFMLGTASSVDFSGLSTVSFTPAGAAVTRTASYVSGAQPPRAGSTTRYSVELTAANPGGAQLTSTQVTAQLPSAVTYVSAAPLPSNVTVSPSGLVTWTVGTLAAFETQNKTLTLDLTPTTGMVGSNADLLTAIAMSGTDAPNNATRTSSAPDVSVGPVGAPNYAPTANPDQFTLAEDGALNLNVLANDSDANNDVLHVGSVTQPSHGVVTINSDGSVRYVPAGDYSGLDAFTYQACDPSDACSTANVSLTVTPVNDPPTATGPDTVTVASGDTTVTGQAQATDPENDPLTYTVHTDVTHGTLDLHPDGTFTYTRVGTFHGDDTFTFKVCDPNNDCDTYTTTVHVAENPHADDFTLAIAEDSGPTTIDLPTHSGPTDATTTTGPVTHGEVVSNPDGTLTYTPDDDFFGTETISYTVCTSPTACDTGIVTINVTPVNDPPTATGPDTVTVASGDTTVTGQAQATDPENDPLTYTVHTDVTHGTLDLHPDGTFTYTRVGTFHGDDTFTFKVCDPNNDCDTYTTTVHVAENPHADDFTLAIAEDSGPTTIDLPTHSGPTDATTTTGPVTHGEVVSNPDGTLTYTPDDDFFGTETISYTVCTSPTVCDTGIVTINVTPVNDPPTATGPDTVTVASGDTTVTGQAQATDPENDPLTYTVHTDVTHGTLDLHPDGTFTYTRVGTFHGDDTFTFKVCDPNNDCDTYTTTVHVAENPHADDFTLAIAEDSGPTTIDLPTHSGPTDATTTTGPVTHGEVVSNPDGTLTYTPDDDFFGTETISYTVCTSPTACDTGIVTINVTPVNDPPTADDSTVSTLEDQPVHVTVSDLASDVDADQLEYSVTVSPTHGWLTISATMGDLVYTPEPGYHGDDSLDWTVCDPSNACATATLAITVYPVNHAPQAIISADPQAHVGDTVVVDGDGWDPDGDSLAQSWSVTGPAELVTDNGDSLTLRMTGTGAVVVGYAVSDGALSDEASTSIDVLAAPIFTPPPHCADLTATSHGEKLHLALSCSHADGGQYQMQSLPAHATVAMHGSDFTYLPDDGFAGTETFQVRVTTPAGVTTAQVTVHVIRAKAPHQPDGSAPDPTLRNSHSPAPQPVPDTDAAPVAQELNPASPTAELPDTGGPLTPAEALALTGVGVVLIALGIAVLRRQRVVRA